MKKSFFKFVDSYFESKLHVAHSDKKHVFYAYSSTTGKSGYSDLFIEDAVNELSDREFKLLFLIISPIKKSNDVYESGVIRISYSEGRFSDYSAKFFRACINKYVANNYIIRTPESKYFILNVSYINKFYKIRKEK